MDTRDSPEQAELRRGARRLAAELGPATVAELDDEARALRLAGAVRDAGWLELRDADGSSGGPLASGVDTTILADGLAGAVADVAFAGPTLAADLARRAGAARDDRAGVAYGPDLLGVAVVEETVTTERFEVVDLPVDGSAQAFVLVRKDDGYRLAAVAVDDPEPGGRRATDLTRTTGSVRPGAAVVEIPEQRGLTEDDLTAWAALGLALTSADLVGVMRGVLDLSVAYATDRKQYGVPVGSFQAVQHLLAEARCLLEGSISATLYAGWAVDELAPDEARAAGRVAKAYGARAARTVCETAVQVHGGIGNTWECMVHVFLRRALLSTEWFGDDGAQLERLARERLGVPMLGVPGVTDGLP